LLVIGEVDSDSNLTVSPTLPGTPTTAKAQ